MPLLRENKRALQTMIKLLRSIKSKIKIPDELPDFLGDRMPMVTLPDYEVVVIQGEIPKWAFYILRGFMFVYYINDKGQVVSHFFGENEIVAFESFLHKDDSAYYIVAGRDTLVATITNNDMQEMYRRWPEMESFAKDVVIAYNKYHLQLQTNLRAMNTKERVAEFYMLYPALLPASWARMDEKIAEYLGISVRTLRECRKMLDLH